MLDITERDFDQAMQADRHRLRQMWLAIRRDERQGRPADRRREKLAAALEKSLAITERRRAAMPAVAFDAKLPICEHRAEIAAAIERRPVVVVCGETGSGKSTQLPKICLEIGRGIHGFIGHTQPRRIAARAIAARLAEELGSHVGGHVGYKIRFTDTVQPATFIKLMTDGILLAETQTDRFLDQYDTLILDEAHERTLNVDFLLGYLKRLLPKRRDLRLVITSATIDAARFAEHFADVAGPVPIIEVSGRGFSIETRYRPLAPDEDTASGDDESDEFAGLVAAVEEACGEGPGDLLVFLATEREIRDAAKRLRGWATRRRESAEIDILPLYARLPAVEQQRVFQPGDSRRIVLATNVAESSLTVPRIRYVIDGGTARVSRYSPRAKVQRLPIEPISRASADQRQGRCGRVGPGICFRLYSEEDYLAREAYPVPEIRRTNLAAVILRMLALNLGPLDHFPLLDPPRPAAVADGFATLFEIGAIDQHQHLTELGRRMSRLPVDPRIARIILAGHSQNCLAEILVIAAALEVQDPRLRPAGQERAADERHAEFADEQSDFLSSVKLWDWFHRLKADVSRSRLRRICQEHFLSFNRIREWQDVHRQLRQLASEGGIANVGWTPSSVRVETIGDVGRTKGSNLRASSANYAAIHRALLAGLLSNIGLRGDGFEYQTAGGGRAFLWPGSATFVSKPRWIVAAESVETTRRYLRTAARIEPEWIEPLAEHLVERSHDSPRWSRGQGCATAHERVTLFGLPIAKRRNVPLGRIDPGTARHLLIQHGLVEGDLDGRLDFLEHNAALVQRLAALSARSRNAGLLIPNSVQYAFYDERLPPDVCDVRSLRRWASRTRHNDPRRLFMQRADLVPAEAAAEVESAFPDTIRADGLLLDIEYRYQPGESADGLNVTVPVELLPQLDAERLEWGVPGSLPEKIHALIRTLPKELRRGLIPAREAAAKAAEKMPFAAGPFLPNVAAALSEVAGEPIAVEAFRLGEIPPHLRVNVRAVDAAGRVVAESHDAVALRETMLGESPDTPSPLLPRCSPDDRWHADGLTRWSFGDLPVQVELPRPGCRIRAYPTLVDAGRTISLRLATDAGFARRTHRGGLRRLVVLSAFNELRAHVAWLPRLGELEDAAASLGHDRDLGSQLIDLLADQAFLEGQPPAHTADDFARLLRGGADQLGPAVQRIAELIPSLLAQHRAAREALAAFPRSEPADALADMRRQFADLTPSGFLVDTPWPWLIHLPRYFAAIVARLDRLQSGGPSRDAEGLAELQPLLDRLAARRRQHAQRGVFDEALETYRWLLEEFRVSVFAQQLGTATKISPQRLERQWESVRW